MAQDIAMDLMRYAALGSGYIAVGLAAIGSSVGTGYAAAAAVGAWKKCYMQNKPAPFLLMALVGAPLSQTIYAMIVMIIIKGKALSHPEQMPVYASIGILCGVAQMISAIFQGRAAAAGCISFAETGKGFANTLMVLGVIETCAIFSLIFSFLAMP